VDIFVVVLKLEFRIKLMHMNKRPVIAIVLSVFVFAFIAYYFFMIRGQEPEISDVYPSYFPKEMISDEYIIGLEVLADRISIPGQSRQASISYKSLKNIENNVADFTNYFQNKEFSVEVVPNEESGTYFIFATKSDVSVSITLWDREPVQVSILYNLN